MTPLVSVIIPNYNGERFLEPCLRTLEGQTFRDFEVLLVDNGSTDGSIALVRERFPQVKVVAMERNLFFSKAVNEGIRLSKSPIVVLLNNDTEVEPQWLRELVGALEQDPQAGMATSKILLASRRDTLNSAGDFYTVAGVPGNRGVWETDLGQYDAQTQVFGACGGAAAYRRSMLEDIGLFDEDFVGYCEDVDLSFRAQLAGYRCVFVPGARVYHHLSATGGGPLASYLCGRNFISVIIKSMPGSLLRKYWLNILAAQMRYALESLRHFREPAARARLRGQLAALRHLRRMLSKRAAIQGRRRVSDKYIESILMGSSKGDRHKPALPVRSNPRL